MRFFYALAVLFITMNLAGQSDYHFFQPEVQYLFENPSEFVGGTNSKEVGIKISEDECVELYRTILVEKVPISPFRRDEHWVVPSFAGLSICQTPDSIRMEVGKENEVVILQHAVLGESWEVTLEDSILVTGRVDSIQEVEINGMLDSVKFINFFKGDTLLLERPVELSKANGLLKGAYFWGLLEMSETLERIDEESVVIPDAESIYSYEVGDERHIEFVETYSTAGVFTFYIVQDIYRVLAVEDSMEFRFITYNSDRLTYMTSDYEGRSDTTDRVLTLNRVFRGRINLNTPNPAWLNKQLGELSEDLPSAGLGKRIIVKTQETCSGYEKFGGIPVFTDGNVYTTASLASHYLPAGTYISNLGGGYYTYDYQEGGFQGRILKYTNRPDVECPGTPLDFSGLTNVENSDEVPEVEVYPNPVSVSIRVTSSVERITALSLYNNEGRLVLRKEQDLESTDVSGLPAGLYNLLVELKDGRLLNKRIVIR